MDINPQPGDAGFATIAGAISPIPYWGQTLLHDACRFDHVFGVVNAINDPGWPDGRIVEAMPSGARFRPLRDRLIPGYAYASPPGLTAAQQAMIPATAEGFVAARNGKGIGYSWLSYPALAAVQYHVLLPGLRRYLGRSDRLICSQLYDEMLRRVGFQLFDDGRWFRDVTPGDIFYELDPRVIQPAPADVAGA